MENKEQQIKEEPKNPKQAESLSEAELDKAAGGAAHTQNTSKGNTRNG
jgi:hypothetical protein